MAISMSEATIESSERDELNQRTFDSDSVSGGVSSINGVDLAGITASFASNVTGKIDSYIENVKTALNNLQNVESDMAFKGQGVTSAISEFVQAIKDVAESFINKLQAAENQIINSVQKAYEQQDADVSGNLSSDTSTLSGYKF